MTKVKDEYLTQQEVTLDKPKTEEEFDGVSASFVRFEDLEEDSYDKHKGSGEEISKNSKDK